MRKKSKFRIKKIYILIILVLVTISIFYTLGKYVINNENMHIQRAEEFYFNSEILNENNPVYNLKDWDGTSEYVLTIDLKSYEDAIRETTLNVNYQIQATTNNENIVITTSKSTGTLTLASADDSVQININNQGAAIVDGGYITVTVTATAISPYSKAISATFNIYKRNYNNMDLNLDDSQGREWTTLTIKTNNVSGQKSLTYNQTKAILDTTNPLFSNYVSITPGQVTLNFEANQIYKIEFIKKDKATALVLGTDINIQ